jgi:peptidoglycan-N-acetylglucosamine deacetylase
MQLRLNVSVVLAVTVPLLAMAVVVAGVAGPDERLATPVEAAAAIQPEQAIPPPEVQRQDTTPAPIEVDGDSNDEAAAQWPRPELDSEFIVRTESIGKGGVAAFTENPQPIIYLTFDDGPHPTWTPQILDTLAAWGASATFFVIGSSADAYSGIVSRTHNDGHALGNHSYYHMDLTTLPADVVSQRLQWTTASIWRPTGSVSRCFRPPFGAVNATVDQVLAQQGLANYLWDVDTRDWQGPGTSVIVQRVVNNAAPGAIVLLHDGGGNRSQTAEALPEILSQLSAQGYVFRPLPC